jgi:tRNA (cmo5U34)-methyltransferase
MSSKNFSFETISDFDLHISESIPNYDLLLQTVLNVAPFFLQENSSVTDLGCSTGKMLKAIPHKGPKIGIDNSVNLLPASDEQHTFINQDLVTFRFPENNSFVTSIFTLQFLPIRNRSMIIDRVYDSLIPGGAFVWAEKVTSKSGFWEQVQTFSYYDFKRSAFSSEEILDKEKSLRYLMRPLTTEKNLDMLRGAGFADFEMLWKFHNFECWIAVK